MIFQTSLVIGSANFIGITNQVHSIDNQFYLNFSTNFIACCEQLHDLMHVFTTSQEQFYKMYNFISQRMVHHV